MTIKEKVLKEVQKKKFGGNISDKDAIYLGSHKTNKFKKDQKIALNCIIKNTIDLTLAEVGKVIDKVLHSRKGEWFPFKSEELLRFELKKELGIR